MSFSDFTAHKAETQKIIDAHKNDFNADTVQSYLDNHGGYKAYVRSLGGVFRKYIDFTGKVTSREQLDEVADYVWGLYDIWGVDYSNGCSYDYAENRYKAKCGCGGAFYPREAPKARFNMNYSAFGFSNDKDLPTVDEMLSRPGKYFAICNCGQGVVQTLKKAGLVPCNYPDPATYPAYYRANGYDYKIIRKASDLQPGDVLLFYNKPIEFRETRTSFNNWESGMFHTAIVGERTDKYIIMYDSGHAYTYYGECRNWRKIGDNKVYQWAVDWIGIRLKVIENLKKPTGWKKISGEWYYYRDGKAVEGWQKLQWSKGENWFWFDSNGVMVTGLHNLSWQGKKDWYYFDKNGCMVKGKATVHAKFNKSGKLTGGEK